MKRTVSALEARRRLGELLESVYHRGDEVVIERAGKPMAVVIPAERYAALERNREELRAFIQRARAGNEHLSEEEVRSIVDEAIAEVRQGATAASA